MPRDIPEVKVVKNERINISIWFVPFIAFIISLWLAYQYFAQLGSEITVEFKSSMGLKANQSQVKFRDVPVGSVKKVTLTEGGKSVIVTIRMNKDAEQFLNKNAKFWVVSPKIDKTGITGLETLVSGSYIQLDSIVGGSFKKDFKGLEESYIDEKNTQGRYFNLNAPSSYNLEDGSLVFYRDVEVGEIKQVNISTNGDFVRFYIFIKDPFHKFINSQTQFWNLSNFNLDFSKARLDISFASTSKILHGGITFSTPSKQMQNRPIDESTVFPLFASKGEARAKKIGYNSGNMRTFQMKFSKNLGKLEIGSPIMFSSFQIGHVVNIESSYNIEKGEISSNVLVDIDILAFGEEIHLQNALQKGLIAKLAQSNPLLDSLFIELFYDENLSTNKILSAKPYDIFPTKQVHFSDMKEQFSTLLNSVSKLLQDNKQPIQSILKNLDKTIKNTNALIDSSDLKKLPQQVNKTLQELDTTLEATQKLISSGALMSESISESMNEVSRASKALERVLRKIDQKPNSLIFGE
jgi:paraquat-inducible protein B